MHRVVNFALSLLLIACAPVFAQQAPLVCDADSDRDIDRNDIALINAARNQPASGPADPRDPDRNGVITVNDARICTQRCTLSQCAVPATNRTPGADAGADQTVFAGAVVTLSGAASSDPDGNSLSYRWRLVSIPSGSTAVLSDPTLVSPTFTADLEGQYRVELIVNDSRVDSAPDEVLINTIPRNTNPVANAGADQMVFTGQLVQLDGSASSDVDGDALQFTWALTTAPSGSTASLSDVHDVQPTFVPDAPGLYRIALTVNDGRGGIVSDSVDVTTQQGNRAPLADAGADQVAIVGQTVLLDGIGSSDPDANALSFRWSFASRPAGSTSALTGALTRTPGFVADRAGDYIVQLIVNDGVIDSAADTVLVTTSNTPPVADAGPDQTAAVDALVALDGNGSGDANNDPLSFLWSFTSVPGGSTATISNPSSPAPTFVADLAGLYVAQLIVNDGAVDSAPDTATIVATETQRTIVVTPASTTLLPSETATLTVTLSSAAGAGGVVVTLTSSAAAVSVPTNVTVAQGASAAQFVATAGSTAGTSIITAASPGFGSGVATIVVDVRTLTIATQSPLVGVGRTITGALTLAQPAGVGGVDVGLSSSNIAIGTVAPASVSIPEGATQGAFAVEGVAVGNVTLSATATGFAAATTTVGVTSNLISIGAIPTVAPGQSQPFPVSLSSPAVGDVTISFASADPGIATVTSSLVIPNGLQIPSANPTISGVGIGATQITATATGFAPDVRAAVVTLTLSFSPASLTIVQNATRNITLNLSAPAPAGGVAINLSVGDTAIATAPAQATVPAGQLSAVVAVTGVAPGTTTLTASAAGVAPAVAAVTVNPAPAINVGNFTIGDDLQVSVNASLAIAAPPVTGVAVTISSADPARLLLSTGSTIAGAATITLNVAGNSATIPEFFLQALDDAGAVEITSSAPGYATDVSTITLTPSGFIINSPSAINTTTFAANTNVQIAAARLAPGSLAFQSTQALRAGFAASAPVANSNTNAGAIVGSPVSILAGASSANVQFDPQGEGSSTISVAAPAGFETPSNFTSITATVTAAAINGFTGASARVGEDMQDAVTVSLAVAPPSPVAITITVASGAVARVSDVGAVLGGTSVVFPNVANTVSRTVFLQGLSQGTTQVTISAPGYATNTQTINVDPSGFIINSPSAINTTTFSANTNIQVAAARLQPGTLNFQENETVRAGLTVPVNLALSDAQIGTVITLPLNFSGNVGTLTAPFDPQNAGATLISVATPAGFETSANFRQITATVTAPAINGFTGANARVGEDMQDDVDISLAVTPPAPVDVVITIDNPAIARISDNGATLGGTSLVLPNVSNTTSRTVFLQGMLQGTAQVTISAPGFAPMTQTINVDPSGFIINSPSAINSTTFSTNTNVQISAARLQVGTLMFQENEAVRGGLTVPVNLAVANATVGAMIGSPLNFGGAIGALTAQFDPLTEGATAVSVTTPAGFETAANFRQITATVAAPAINGFSGASARVGEDMQDAVSISLGVTPPSAVDITVSIASTSIARVSDSGTLLGGAIIVIPGVANTTARTVFLQGMAQGATQVTVSAPGYATNTQTINVDPSGFIINSPSAITTTAAAANSNVQIAAARLQAGTFSFQENEAVRAGLTVAVPVTSSNPAAGAITISPLNFGANTGSLTTQFDPLAAGAATIVVGAPAGFDASNNFRQITATVNP